VVVTAVRRQLSLTVEIASPKMDQASNLGGLMFVHRTFWMWTQGQFTVSQTISLDRNRRYLVTGALTGKSGGDYGQVFIATVCTMPSNDQILCGIRDDPADPPADNIANLGIVELLSNAVRVTVKLRGDGGLHRAEGLVYDIT
jgi:hypothetical protein